MPWTSFIIFWHRNLRVEWSPEHLYMTIFCAPLHILYLICVEPISTSMPLSSPELTTSRVCISPSQPCTSTIVMKKKGSRTSQISQRLIWTLVKQHCLVSCSLLLPFLILLRIPSLLLCIVPRSLTLQLPASFPSSCPQVSSFWQWLCALGQASWHWPQIEQSEFSWGKKIIAHLYCTVSVLSIWKLMTLLAFNSQMGRDSLISPDPSNIEEC